MGFLSESPGWIWASSKVEKLMLSLNSPAQRYTSYKGLYPWIVCTASHCTSWVGAARPGVLMIYCRCSFPSGQRKWFKQAGLLASSSPWCYRVETWATSKSFQLFHHLITTKCSFSATGTGEFLQGVMLIICLCTDLDRLLGESFYREKCLHVRGDIEIEYFTCPYQEGVSGKFFVMSTDACAY